MVPLSILAVGTKNFRHDDRGGGDPTAKEEASSKDYKLLGKTEPSNDSVMTASESSSETSCGGSSIGAPDGNFNEGDKSRQKEQEVDETEAEGVKTPPGGEEEEEEEGEEGVEYLVPIHPPSRQHAASARPAAGIAVMAPPPIARMAASLQPKQGFSSGGAFRHEALEELADNVRDLRAEAHGRPSLCERRFTSLRRSNSCGSLTASLGLNGGMRAMLEGLAEAAEEEEDAAAAAKEAAARDETEAGEAQNGLAMPGPIGRRISNESTGSGSGSLGASGRSSAGGSSARGGILRRGSNFGPGGGATRASLRGSIRKRRSQRRSVAFGGSAHSQSSGGADGDMSPSSSRRTSLDWSGRSSVSRQLADEIYGELQSELGPDGDDFVSPRTASLGAVEAVYSLVSALYGLSDSLAVQPAEAAAVLDHTPRLDLAFGRIKPVLSSLIFESDFGDGDGESEEEHGRSYADCLDDDDCSLDHEELERRRMLVRHIRYVSRLVDAVAETVRRVTDRAGDREQQQRPGNLTSASSSSCWTPALECCYVTLLELVGAGCAMIKKVDKEMSSAMSGDYAADGGMPGYTDFNASAGSMGMESALMNSAGALGGMFGSAGGGMDLAGSGLQMASDEDKKASSRSLRWKLSPALRRTWSKAAPDALKFLTGGSSDGNERSLSFSTAGAASGAAALIVDLDLFREAAPLVLRGLEWCPPSYLKFASASSSSSVGEKGGEPAAGDGAAAEGEYLHRTKERREGQGEGDFNDPERELALNDLQDASDLRDAEILVGLGDLRSSLKEYEIALAHYREAVRILRFHYGNDDPVVAAVHEAVGNTYRSLGRYNEAGTCYDRALRSRRQSNDPNGDANHTATVSLLKSWTALKEETGEIDEAIDTLGYCLDLQVKKLEQRRQSTDEIGGDGEAAGAAKSQAMAADGATVTQVADTMQRRGSLCMESGRVDAAMADFNEVLRLRREEDGPDSPSVGDALHTVGLLRFRSHDTEKALESMWEALRIRKIAASEEEKKEREGGGGKGWWDARLLVADTLVIVGMIHHEMGAPDAAVQFLAECLDLRSRGMGSRNEKVADVHAALGRAHRDLDHFEDSAKHYYGALIIIERIHGASDRRIPKLMLSIGTLEFKSENYANAQDYLEKFLQYQRESGNVESVEYVTAMHMLGKIKHKAGDTAAAKKTLKEAEMTYAVNNLASRRMTLGKDLIATLKEMSTYDLDSDIDGNDSTESWNNSLDVSKSKDTSGGEGRAGFDQSSFFASVGNFFGGNKMGGLQDELEIQGSRSRESLAHEDRTDEHPRVRNSRASMSAKMLSDLAPSGIPMMALDHIWDDTQDDDILSDLVSDSFGGSLSSGGAMLNGGGRLPPGSSQEPQDIPDSQVGNQSASANASILKPPALGRAQSDGEVLNQANREENRREGWGMWGRRKSADESSETSIASSSVPEPPAPSARAKSSMGMGVVGSLKHEVSRRRSDERRGFWGGSRNAGGSGQGRAKSMGFGPKREEAPKSEGGEGNDSNWLVGITKLGRNSRQSSM